MVASNEPGESDLWRTAYGIFERAMELEATGRDSFVLQQCAGDPSLVSIVRELIDNAEADEEFNESSGDMRVGGNSIRTGTTFGRYEVLHRLGRGAMGQVYAARDTELDRQVALKFLSSASSSSGGSGSTAAERLILEAKAASALNHPHIVTVYEVVREADDLALAMELVDGEPLRHYCSQAQDPERVADWARQIAQALGVTHSHGIVHRDIKPENLMVRHDGFVKILDFGLARRRRNKVLSVSSKSTEGGGPLAGTLRYMSPEQTRGMVPGPAGDIFSLGIVLAELLCGRHPFEASSPIDTAYAIAHAEPVLPLQGALPDLIRQMLAKDPVERPGAAEIEQRLATTSNLLEGAKRTLPSRRLAVALGAMAAVALLAGIAYSFRSTLFPKSNRVVRFQLAPPEGTTFRLRRGSVFAVSPDDRSVVVEVVSPGRPERLVLRKLDAASYQELPGTELGSSPFFSPDGQEIGFYHPTGLLAYSLTTGKIRQIVTFATKSDAQRAIWPVADTIYYLISGSPDAGLYAVRSDGSNRRLLSATTQRSSGEPLTLFPRALDGNRLLVAAVRSDRRLAALDLDTNALRFVMDSGQGGSILPSGHLVFYRDGSLVATRIDRDFQVDGRVPVPVVRGVEDAGWAGGYYDITPGGTLAYLPAAGPPPRQLVWVDLSGKETPLPMPPAAYEPMSISPDGSQAAIARYESEQHWTLFLHDFRKGSWIVVDEGSGRRPNAVWSPDGHQVAFPSLREGTHRLFNVYLKDFRVPEGSAESVRRLTVEKSLGQIPQAWDRRHDMVIYGQGTHPQTLGDLYAVRPSDPSHPVLVAGGPGYQSQPAVSPSGRWIAYRDCQDSCYVRVRPFLREGDPVTVGEMGAFGPQWSPAGDALYIIQHREVQAVPFSDAAGKPVGRARTLFPAPYYLNTDHWGRTFALSPDGKRFLFAKPVDKTPRQPQLEVIVNWASELNRLAP